MNKPKNVEIFELLERGYVIELYRSALDGTMKLQIFGPDGDGPDTFDVGKPGCSRAVWQRQLTTKLREYLNGPTDTVP